MYIIPETLTNCVVLEKNSNKGNHQTQNNFKSLKLTQQSTAQN